MLKLLSNYIKSNIDTAMVKATVLFVKHYNKIDTVFNKIYYI